MIQLLRQSEFTEKKREPLLDYLAYADEAADLIDRVPRAAKKLADREWTSTRDEEALLRLTDSRARHALNLITISYSAGTNLNALQDFFADLLSYYEEFALYSESYNATQSGTQALSPHIYIQDIEFERANRLLCFAILLALPNAVSRIMALIDYNNPIRDGMLERLASFYTKRAKPAPSECTRHLPYFKTLTIFDAPPQKRAELIRAYLQDWYEASRREPYYNSHARNNNFLGYWSWEAAAITVALQIDDSSYCDMPFYPKDLVEFASANKGSARITQSGPSEEIRARAGEPCPIAGRWESIGVPFETSSYAAGALMKDLKSPYGLTVWRLAAPDY